MENNESFKLSIQAQNVEAKFYNKQGIVYVEGPDDVIFWAQYFDNSLFEIRHLNGCRSLDDYENDIMNHGLKCIVAKDSDYSTYMHSAHTHPLIVCTLSHSIECIMYCPYNINAYLQKLSRTLEDYTKQIASLYDTFCEECTELIIYDIANNVFKVGCEICGNSCQRFLKSDKSISLSKEKVDQFIKNNQSRFTPQQIFDAKNMLKMDKRHKRQICKGHFQTIFVINLIKRLYYNITGFHSLTIPKDALFTQLVNCNPKCSQNCEERDYIRNKVSAAIAALRY